MALTRKTAATVSVGTYSAWESTGYVVYARRRARRLGAHGGGEGREHIVSQHAQLALNILLFYDIDSPNRLSIQVMKKQRENCENVK